MILTTLVNTHTHRDSFRTIRPTCYKPSSWAEN